MNTHYGGGQDRIELMQTFIRIVESGSLSAAAMRLNTTQPTISRRLQALEKLLGLKLIQRTTHAFKLTDDGERCYAHARQLLETWHALADELTGASDAPAGTLRVRAPHAFGQDQMIAPLAEYLRRYPQVNVEWMLNDHSPDFIADGVDCAIQVGTQLDPALVAILLAEVPRIIVASPELLAAHPSITGVEQLTDLPWLALSTFYRNEIVLSRGEQEKVNLAIAPRLSSDSLYAIQRAARSGLGIAIVSAWIVQDDLTSGKLVHLLPEWQASPLPVYLIYPWASYYPARLRTFLAMMKAVMPGLTGTQAIRVGEPGGPPGRRLV